VYLIAIREQWGHPTATRSDRKVVQDEITLAIDESVVCI
jgi:hypothetical protein